VKFEELKKLKAKAMDRLLLCKSVFDAGKPPRAELCVEMQAHAALVQALNSELRETRLDHAQEVFGMHIRGALAIAEEMRFTEGPTSRRKQELVDLLRAMAVKAGVE
jgi:hypothetical protein